MCCLNIHTDTLIANCLNLFPKESFSFDDLNNIINLISNITNRYVICDLSEQAINNVIKKYHFFEFKSAMSISLHDNISNLPMKFFNFGYSKKTINMLSEIIILYKKK